MIGYIRGNIILIDGSELVVEAGGCGVGYRILAAARSLGDVAEGDAIELHIYTHIREDAMELYGFRTRDERRLFIKLISVKGVGPKLALDVLNTLTPAELQVAILTGNTAALKKIPNVGATTASRLCLEMEKFLKTCHFADVIPDVQKQKATSTGHADTRSALKNLGIGDADIERVMVQLDESGEKLDVQGEIRWALKALSN